MKYKKIAVISIILLAVGFILFALSNSTFALFSSDDYANRPDSFSTGLLQIEIESKTENISLTDTLPMEDIEGVQSEPYVFSIKNVGNLDYQFDVKLLSTGVNGYSFSPQYIKLQIDDGEVTTLSSLTNSVVKGGIVLKAGESIDVSIRLWLSIDTPNTELGKSFNSKIITDGQAIYTESNYGVVTFADYITNLYIGDAKESVTNNNIVYNYGTSTNLMSDKLGGALDYDNGNIRYYGANPNNYVYFNCADYSNPSDSTCEKWRIIGIFDGKVKLVRGSKLGNYSWDWHYSDGTYDNNWHDATLNSLLNGSYYNNKDEYYVNNNWEYDYGEFYSYGIGITAATRKYISNTSWYTNGVNSGSYSNELYINERNGSSTWNGKIALMYPSDYGYAVDFRKCNKDVFSYKDSNCTSYNWIYKMNGTGNSAPLITHNSSRNDTIWRIVMSGELNKNSNASLAWNIFPTLYLDNNIFRVSGDGTSSDPYVITNNVKESTSRGNIINYITNLFVSNNPSLITQKDSSGNDVADYYYASSVSLMNDGLGDTVNDTNALTSGTQGNIRYYGKNPNNYIYFNCDDYSNQSDSTCERWRIIGIVDEKVKIIHEAGFGGGYHYGISWDLTSTGEYDNNWHDSTLMTILNDGYYNRKDNIKHYIIYNTNPFFNANEKILSTGEINFGASGIKSNTRNLISDSIWYLGGHSDSKVYPNEIYAYERGNKIGANSSKTWDGKIALMYPSDYGYSFDLSKCNSKLYDYNFGSDECRNTTWLYGFGGTQWLLTPRTFSSNEYVFGFDGSRSGSVFDELVQFDDYFKGDLGSDYYKFIPTLHLDPNLTLSIKGDGSYNEPYQIEVNS